MVRRLLVALVAVPLSALPAAASSEASMLRAREAGVALNRGNIDQAITLYSEALEDKTLPNDRRATILTDRGVAYARRQQHKEAIDDFNRAVQLYPEHAAVYNNRGNVLLGLGAAREAIKDFDRALVLAPGYAAAYTNRAGASMKLGQFDQALADYTKAIELTPASPAALSGRGRAHLAAHRPHAAIRDFTRAAALDKGFGAAYRARAEAKLVVERFDDAIEDFSRAIAFEPRNTEVYALRGYAYLEADNPASAVMDFTKAVELNPQAAVYFASRGLSYAKAEAYDEALNDFARAIELDPRSPRAYAYRAWTYRQQQQPELGLKDIERALKLDPNSAEAHWARGEIYETLGKAELAVADLKKALALQPRLKEATRALERMGLRLAVEKPEVPDAGFERWRVFQDGRQFVATNEEYPRLKVQLEMMGKGQPRILEWDVKNPPFAGIAVLRFHAGVVTTPRGEEEVEHAAIVDLHTNAVVSVEVQRHGARLAQWTWEEGKLVVASADGTTDEFQLRQGKPKDAPPLTTPKRYAGEANQQKGTPSWAPWAQGPGSDAPPQRSGRKPKTLFDLLFKY